MNSSTVIATTSPLRTASVHVAAADTFISEADISLIRADTRDYIILAVSNPPDRLIIANAVTSLARSANARIVIVNGDAPAVIIAASAIGSLASVMIPDSLGELIRKISQFCVTSGKFSVIEVSEKYCAKSKGIEVAKAPNSVETRIVLEKIRLPDNQLTEIVNKALERFNNGNFQDTLPLIRQVTSSRRDITDAFFIQGVTEAKLGMLPEAARSLNAVLEVNSGHSEATRLLAEIRTALGY